MNRQHHRVGGAGGSGQKDHRVGKSAKCPHRLLTRIGGGENGWAVPNLNRPS